MGDLDLDALLSHPELRSAGIVILALLGGYAVVTALAGVLTRTTAQVYRDLEDHLVALARRPVWVTVLLVVIELAGDLVHFEQRQQDVFDATLGTIAVVVWTVALTRAAEVVLSTLNRREGSWMRGRVTAVVRYAAWIGLLLLAAHAIVLLWDLDLRTWQLSAGVIGAVLAMGAQDSLRNVVSGVFIAADEPLRIGDVVEVEGGARGRVTSIGWRSTRLLTRDGVEISVPNGLLADLRIVNESGGPSPAVRICCEFPVEPGWSPDEVAAIVLPGVTALPEVVPELAPELRFFGAGPHGLRYGLRVFIADP
ncbi:MAG TPA: mechanosensitive ion channel domain-containing protein, partial [Nannocystis sp.]